MKTNTILQGDSLSKLKELPDKSINMCLTSPPYWALRDYGTASWEGGNKDCNHLNGTLQSMKTTLHPGTNQNDKRNFTGMPFKDVCGKCGAKRVDKQLGLEPTFDEYINNLCDIFDQVKRVLRDDGTCWVNVGDTYYGSGKGVGGDITNSKQVWGFTEKVKKICKNCGKGFDGYKFQNFCGSACSGVDNTSRIKKGELQDKCLTLIPFRFAIEMVNRGWILRNTLIWHKPNSMPSSVKDRFTVDFEYIFLFSKKQKYYFEQQTEPSEYFKNVSTPKSFGGSGHIGNNNANRKDRPIVHTIGRNKRAVWKINPKGFKEAHFAVYPEKLCETPIKAGCPKGGIVLDPFFGSGTTGVVALKQSKKFIGIELNSEYIEISNKRLKPYLEQTKLTNIIK